MSKFLLAGLALMVWLTTDALAQNPAESLRRAREAGRLNEARAMNAMREAYGQSCPSGFNPVLQGGTVLLCQIDLTVPLALRACPPERPNYFTRTGARDVCLRNNFLPEGRLEAVGREGVDFHYAEPQPDALEQAELVLERSWGQRLTARPPVGLRDTGRFAARVSQIPKVPQEHAAIPMKAVLVADALADSGEDATVVTFRVFTPSIKFKP